MGRHRPDRRRVKLHSVYTVDQAARTVGVGKATVRRWLKNGLSAIDNRKPALIRGVEFRQFLNSRVKPKQTCPPGQCYCVKCKAPHPPDGGLVDFVKLTATTGNLRGLCPVCGTMMHRRRSLTQLDQLKALLNVSIVDRF